MQACICRTSETRQACFHARPSQSPLRGHPRSGLQDTVVQYQQFRFVPSGPPHHNGLHGCVCIHLGEGFPREAVPCPGMDRARIYDLARTHNVRESRSDTDCPSRVRIGHGLPHGSYDTFSCRLYRNIQSSVNMHVPALFVHWPSLDAASFVVA